MFAVGQLRIPRQKGSISNMTVAWKLHENCLHTMWAEPWSRLQVLCREGKCKEDGRVGPQGRWHRHTCASTQSCCLHGRHRKEPPSLSGCGPCLMNSSPPLSVRPSVRPSARPPARPPARPSVRPPARPPGRPPIRPSVRSSVRPSAHPSVRPVGRSAIWLDGSGREHGDGVWWWSGGGVVVEWWCRNVVATGFRGLYHTAPTDR